MKFYAASTGNIQSADMEMFAKIQSVLGAMPDMVFDPKERGWDACTNQVSCHLVCRALAKHFDASVHDGYFVTGYQHSWLVPESGSSIIDAYPVAGAVPFIVSRDLASPWGRLYKDSDGLNYMFVTDTFQERLKQTMQAVSETVRQLGL